MSERRRAHPLVPGWLLDQLANGQVSGTTIAAALLVDVVGFTATTDALAGRGDLGAEQLAALLDTVFDPLVATVDRHGGFVSTFSGDGFTGIFPGGSEACTRAVGAALAMQDRIARAEPVSLPDGTYTPQVRVGIGHGDLRWMIITSPDEERATYLIYGDATARAAAAETAGRPGAVSVTNTVAAWLDDRFARTTEGDGWVVTDGPHQPDSSPATPPTGAGAGPFYPSEIFEWDRPAEFRQVVSVFANVEATAIGDAMDVVFGLQQRHGGLLSPPEFADKGCVVMMLWGVPVGLEDDLNRATRFAHEFARRMGGRVRIGLSYGTVFAGFVGSDSREQYTCYGSSVNLAARLMGVADWGEVMVDATAAARAGELFDMQFQRQEHLKGFGELQEVYRLGSPQQAKAAPVTSFIGRHRELAALVDVLEGVVERGETAATLVQGEAGIGKTRLVAEARRRLPPDVAWFVCPSDARSTRALGPWRRLVEQLFGQEAGASPDANRASFAKRWDELSSSVHGQLEEQLEMGRSFLQAFVDLPEPGSTWERASPAERAARTSRALMTLLEAVTSDRPLVLEFADLQWADSETHDFLAQAFGLSLPLAMIMTSRPLEAELPFVEQTFRLEPLDTDDLGALAADLLGRPISPELASWLAERCDGNPFNAHQVIKYLQERDLLSGDTPATVDTSAVEVPPDVRAVVVARLDVLEPGVRTVVQLGAILGREFDPFELEHMLTHQAPPVPPQAITTATAEQVWSQEPGGLLRFDNAMVQEAAYSMQLQSTRQDRHLWAASSIEHLHQGALDPHFASLAFHYEAADHIDSAVHYLNAAGAFALRSGNHAEAGAHAERALGLLPDAVNTGPDVELGLNNTLGVSRIATHGQAAPETLEPYERAATLSREAGDTPEAFQALFGVRTHYLFRGEHHTAADLADRGLEIAERLADEDLLLEAHLNVGNSHFWAGELPEAVTHLSWVLEHYRPEMHHSHLVRFAQNPRITAVFPLAHSLWLQGRTGEAETLVEGTVELATQLDHSFSQALAIQTEAYLRVQLRQPERVARLATRLIELASRDGFPVYIPVGNIPLGWAQAKLGDATGLKLIQQSAELLRSRGMGISQTLFTSVLGDAAIATGQPHDAHAAIEEAVRFGATQGERAFLPELHRLQAHLAEAPEALRLLRTAIDLAVAQGATPWEYRSRMDLAGLLAHAGQVGEGFDILRVVLEMSPPSGEEAGRAAALAQDIREGVSNGKDD